ncbi:hypothetical protein Scep_020257 [Stephania cephalantha]|uniref:Uncharacterized protein n=1 Tax=Stephania cephalantha TaxID=152367 RepID=A0AAP0ICE7_9MAGN
MPAASKSYKLQHSGSTNDFALKINASIFGCALRYKLLKNRGGLETFMAGDGDGCCYLIHGAMVG